MPELESLIGEVLAVRDTPAVQALCLDCWLYGKANGERAGVLLATDLLAGVRRYREHEAGIRRPLMSRVAD